MRQIYQQVIRGTGAERHPVESSPNTAVEIGRVEDCHRVSIRQPELREGVSTKPSN